MTKNEIYLDRYRILEPLGRGGTGQVWLAYDSELETEVALKFLKERFSDEDREMLKRETRQARQLTHRHILPIYDFHYRSGEKAAISMEFAPGGSVHDWITDENPLLEAREIAVWMRQACDALSYAHESCGIIHRDIKPSNLMLDSGNDLKVADFGLSAKLALDLDARSEKTIGRRLTLHFASPQLIWNPRESHHLNDIYALGVTIFFLLTGTFPFDDPKRGRWKWDPENPLSMSKRRAELGRGKEPIPDSWDVAVARCLAEDPADRPSSVRKLSEMMSESTPMTGAPLSPGPAPASEGGGAEQGDSGPDRFDILIRSILTIVLIACLGLLVGLLWGAFAISG